VIVYIIGGVTYEESYHIQMMNKQGARIVLGGSHVHNFSSFMDEVIAGAPSTPTVATPSEPLATKRR
jgi:vacuolar protein sorting-associated protein 45